MSIDLVTVDPVDVAGTYFRSGMDRWPLDRLAEVVEAGVADVVDDVDAEHESFYLHAPLEFMARMELMTALGFETATTPRIQLLSLAVRCAHLGPSVPRPVGRPLAEGGVEALVEALEVGDRTRVDQLADQLDRPELVPSLVPHLVPFVSSSLEAASHGVIFLQYLHLLGTKARNTSFLRRMLRELAVRGEHQRITSPPPGSVPESPFRLPSRHSRSEDSGSIAGAIDLVQGEGLLAPWYGWADQRDLAPDIHVGLQRLASSVMIFGGDEDVQFGWTHALSIPQATLDLATVPATALYPSMGYLAIAHLCGSWYPVEERPLEMADPLDYERWGDDEFRGMVGRALAGEDAHRVKYLVCARRAIEVDPSGGPIYAEATRRLDAWWEARSPT